MRKLTLFLSWQSDVPENRSLLRKKIDDAIKALSKDLAYAKYLIERDEATRNESGSPNIEEVLHQKINQCAVFIADVSPVLITNNGQRIPNPNVLHEEGFALRCVGRDRIILISDSDPEILPFDISHRRITSLQSDLVYPIRMALRAAIDNAAKEYEQNVIGHDSKVYQEFANIIYSEEYFFEILRIIPVNLRISQHENKIFENLVAWHNSGNGKYLNEQLAESANALSYAVESFLQIIQESIVDNLDKSDLPEYPTEDDWRDARRHQYWYFKKLAGTNSYEEDQVVWDTQEKLYKATELVKKAYTYYRDDIRKVLFI